MFEYHFEARKICCCNFFLSIFKHTRPTGEGTCWFSLTAQHSPHVFDSNPKIFSVSQWPQSRLHVSRRLKANRTKFYAQSLRNDHEARFCLRWVLLRVRLQIEILKVSLALALNLSVIGVSALKYFDSFDKVQLIFVHGLVHFSPLAQNIHRQILILSFSHSVLSASTFDNTRYSLNNSSSLINHRLFNRNRRTVLLTHGMYASSVLREGGKRFWKWYRGGHSVESRFAK